MFGVLKFFLNWQTSALGSDPVMQYGSGSPTYLWVTRREPCPLPGVPLSPWQQWPPALAWSRSNTWIKQITSLILTGTDYCITKMCTGILRGWPLFQWRLSCANGFAQFRKYPSTIVERQFLQVLILRERHSFKGTGARDENEKF